MSLDLSTELDLVGDTSELTLPDIRRYEELGPAEPPTVDKVAIRHHRMADLLAHGHTVKEVAYLCGVHQQTVYHLNRNPVFQELVKAAAQEIISTDRILSGQLQELAMDGLSALQKAVREETISGDTLRKVTEGALDRVGLGPTKRIEKRSFHVNVETLEKIRRSVREAEETGNGLAMGRVYQIESAAAADEGGQGQGHPTGEAPPKEAETLVS